MLAAQRHAAIMRRLEDEGAVRVTDLMSDFAVSDMTVRRDLELLAGRGLLIKVHGGATLSGGLSTERHSSLEPGFPAKSAQQREQKLAIARAALALVEPGSAIGLSAGSTTWALADLLVEVPQITVVTNSVQVADVMHPRLRSDQTLVLTGGVRTPSDALVGPVAVNSLTSLNLDTVFLGVHGMDPAAGFSTPNLLEAETNRALVATGQRLVVLADSTKWGVVGMSTMAELEQADVLVSDDALPRPARHVLAERVGELIVAGTRPQAATPTEDNP